MSVRTSFLLTSSSGTKRKTQAWNRKNLHRLKRNRRNCISQEREQLLVKLVTLISEEKQQSEAEPNCEQLLYHNTALMEIKYEEESWRVDSGSTKEEPKPKKRRLKTRSHSNRDDDSLTSKPLCKNETDFPEQHVCENKFSPDQQLWNQEENSDLEQEEPPQVKEEQEELCISQEREQLLVKLVTLISEEKQQSEAEPNSEQLLYHNTALMEIKDEEESWRFDSAAAGLPSVRLLSAVTAAGT
ncbi:uncharacterized protein KZ484_010980 [Pholidichthys leucotaenia]